MTRHLVGRLVAALSFVFAFVAVPFAAAQTAPADRAAVEKTLIANENKILEAFPKKDIATLKSLIADDGFGGDMMGFKSVSDMYKELPTMDLKLESQSTAGHAFHWVDPNTVILTYTWTGKGSAMGQTMPSPTYASTVWTKRGAKWVAIFHQETVATPMPAGPKK